MKDKVARNDLCPCGSGKKYKKCCMESKSKVKDCFGSQGGSLLYGEAPINCFDCEKEIFDRCHKVSIAASLQRLNTDSDLVIQNGLRAGWLKCLEKLSEEGSEEGSK
jgi:hypothetical protein